MVSCFTNFFFERQPTEPSIPTFPMDSLLQNLQSLVLEKMLYADFATFNACSSFSSEMCAFLPTKLKLILKVEEIYITNTVHGYINVGTVLLAGKKARYQQRYGKKYFGVFINSETEKEIFFKLHCSKLFIHRHDCLEDLAKYGVTTDFLTFGYWPKDEDLPLIDTFLKVTKTKAYANSGVSSRCFELESIRKLPQLQLQQAEVDDSILLSLESPKLYLEGQLTITPSGFARFIKQWVNGERQIHKVTLIFEEPSDENQGNLDLVREILGEENYKNDPNVNKYLKEDAIFVYRKEDCIRVVAIPKSAVPRRKAALFIAPVALNRQI